MKLLSFSAYKRAKAMSFRDFNTWVGVLYAEAYEDGRKAGEAEAEKRITGESESYTYEEFYNILVSVKGISPRIADKVMEIMLHDKKGGR